MGYSWYGQMLQGQISPGQMLLWQLEIVQDGSRNLPLKFGQNRVSNSWDMLCLNYLPGWVGGWLEKMGIKLSQPQFELKLSWVELRLSLAIDYLKTYCYLVVVLDGQNWWFWKYHKSFFKLSPWINAYMNKLNLKFFYKIWLRLYFMA